MEVKEFDEINLSEFPLENIHVNGDSIFVLCDSREMIGKINTNSIDCIITSPPYLNIKNYGGETQIGFGQTTEDYYSDMKETFQELYICAKEGAAFWLVVDNVKKGNGLIMLPYVLSQLATAAGWKLHDVIVWDKGKSLPWGHKGKFRGVCEHIVLLGKGNLKTFNLDAVRDSGELSPYWIKYPERYSPSGKSPSNIWHFPIPVQGSWSSDLLKHDCPFPIEMVSRMILLSTEEGNTILDPFAGSGAVAKSSVQNSRRCISFESSKDYFDMFAKNTLISNERNTNVKDDGFYDIVMNLRRNKMPIQLFKLLARPNELNGIASKNTRCILAVSDGGKNIEIFFLVEDNENIGQILAHGEQLLKKPPLSKYELTPKFYVTSSAFEFSKIMKKTNKLYEYRAEKFYGGSIEHKEIDISLYLHALKPGKYPPLITNINVDVEFSE